MTECYILCSVSEDAHALDAGLGSNAYQHFAASVQHVRRLYSSSMCTCISDFLAMQSALLKCHLCPFNHKQLCCVHQAWQQDGPFEQQNQEEEQEVNPDRTKADPVAVTVQYFPLHVCPLTDSAFVLPASSPITAARCVSVMMLS
jgi:hypothetical protein